MIILTENARKAVEGYFEGQDKQPIRVYLDGGCHGAMLGLYLDAPTEADSAYEAGGFTFCLDKELEEAIGDVNIDIDPSLGFVLTTERPLPEVPSSCGGCCSACGSHAEAEGGCGSESSEA